MRNFIFTLFFLAVSSAIFGQSAPTVQSSGLYVYSKTSTSISVGWTNASGTSGRIAVIRNITKSAKAPSSVVTTSTYTPNTAYGTASADIGSKNYCVLKGTSSYVTITGLSPDSGYVVNLYEYNTSGSYNYFNLTSSPSITFYTLAATEPTTEPGNPTISSIGSNTVTYSFTAGNGSGTLFGMYAGNPRTSLSFDGTNDYLSIPYSSSLQPANEFTLEAWAKKSVWTGMASSTIVGNYASGGYSITTNNATNNLEGKLRFDGSLYTITYSLSNLTTGWHHFAIGLQEQYTFFNYSYYFYLIVDGTVRASQNLGTSATRKAISYTYNNNLIIGAEAGSSTAPTGKYLNAQVDEVRLWNIYRSVSSSYNLQVTSGSGLVGSWTMDDGYYASTVALNKQGNTSLNGTLTGFSSVSAATAFTTTSGWALSNAPINVPYDGNAYAPSTTFGSGSLFGGTLYSVQSDGLSTRSVSNLSPATTYTLYGYSYNGQSNTGAENYLTSKFGYATFTTLSSQPTTQSATLTANHFEGTGMRLSWIRGNGAYRIVLMKDLTSGNSYTFTGPADGSTYTSNSAFGSGSQIGATGEYVVYNGTGNYVDITGLTPGNRYAIGVFEFNGSGVTTNYLMSTSSNVILQYNAEQKVNNVSTNFQITNVTKSSANFSWTNGDGQYRLVAVRPGENKTALSLDGVNDYVSVGNESQFDFTNAMTVEAWIKVNAFDKYYQAIVTKGDNSWRLHRYGSTNTLAFAINYSSSGYYETVGTINVNDGRWHHVAGVFTGSQLQLYIDGIMDSYYSVTGGTIYNNSYNVAIGENLQSTGRNFNGQIDEVRVWNKSLSATDFTYIKDAPVPNSYSNLIAYYKCDDFSGSTLKNSTVKSGLDGSLVNMGTAAASNFTNTSGWVYSGSQINAPLDLNYSAAYSVYASTYGKDLGDGYYTVSGYSYNSSSVNSLLPNQKYNVVVYEFNGVNTSSSNKVNYKTDQYLVGSFTTASDTVPVITSISPTSIVPGKTLTITGTSLFTNGDALAVWIGNIQAPITYKSSTQIKVTVPQGAYYAPVTVQKNGLVGQSARHLVIKQNCNASLTSATFSTSTGGTTLTSSGNAGSSDLADFDLDGKIDVVSNNLNTGKLNIFKNTSTSGISFSTNTVTSDSAANVLLVADLDNDQKLDIITTNRVKNTFSMFRNSGTNVVLLAGRQDYASSVTPLGMAAADFNRDGKLDVVMTTQAGQVLVYQNTGSKGKLDMTLYSSNSIASANLETVQVADFDGDGDMDIVTANKSGNNYYILLNSSVAGGSISINSPLTYSVTASNINHFDIGDFNSDGKMDLAFAVYNSTGPVNAAYVYRNTTTSGSPAFTLGSTLTTLANQPNLISVNDLNGDDKPDILLGYATGTAMSVFVNNSTASIAFNTKVDLTVNASALSGLLTTDFNQDNQPDIYAANSSTTVNVYKNNSQTLASEPNTPASALSVTNLTQTSATLSFATGSGSERLVVIADVSNAIYTTKPMDGNSYSPSTVFGNSSSDIGGNYYAVFSGNGSSVTVTGLNPSTYYYVSVFEYNGSGCTANYYTTNFLSGYFYTDGYQPTLDSIPSPAPICVNSGEQTVNLTGISNGGEGNQLIEVYAYSNNTALIPHPAVSYLSPDATATLSYTPVPGASGTAEISVTVWDEGFGNSEIIKTFTVTVNPQPTAAVLPNHYIAVCGGQVNLSGNVPQIGTAAWSIVSNSPSASLSTLTGSSTILSGLVVDDSVLVRYTISNTPCSDTYDEVWVKRNNCPFTADFVASSNLECFTPGDTVYVTYTDNSVSNGTNIVSYSWDFGSNAIPSSAVGVGPHLVGYVVDGFKDVALVITDDLNETKTVDKFSFVEIRRIPDNPQPLSSVPSLCQGAQGIGAEVTGSVNAVSYSWMVPNGFSITAGDGSSSVLISATLNAVSDTLRVFAINSCGTSLYPALIPLTVDPLPDAVGVITTTVASVCEGEVVQLSVPMVANAEQYSWTVGNNCQIIGQANGNTIDLESGYNAGVLQVSVSGLNLCGSGVPASVSINVDEKPDSILAVIGNDLITDCPSSSGLVYQVTPTANTHYYIWTLPSGVTITSGDSTSNIITDFTTSAISGSVTVTGVNGCGIGNTYSYPVVVNRVPDPAGQIAGPDSLPLCQNQGVVYQLQPVFNASGYSWTLPNGFAALGADTLSSISLNYLHPEISQVIAVTPYNACGNGATSYFTIQSDSLPMQSICMVTVDSLNHNTVVWEKIPLDGSVNYYNIYREDNITDEFNLIAKVPVDSLSEYVDLDASVDPTARSYRYRMAIEDSCGNVSWLSAYHKTMHVAILRTDVGGILNKVDVIVTDRYEGKAYQSYKIYRVINNQTPMLIGSNPTTNNGFTDNNVGGILSSDVVDYFVTTEDLVSCTADRSKNYNHVRSNTQNLRTQNPDAIRQFLADNFVFAPNPSTGLVTIHYPVLAGLKFSVVNTLGQSVYTSDLASTGNGVYTADLTSLTSGVYFLQLEGYGTLVVKKIVKQ